MKRLVVGVLAVSIITMATLCYFGVIWPNSLFANRYSIHGIDVSNHQKDIDWKQIADNDKIRFAFIKATEGKDFKDKYFQTNWNSASQAELYKGAYHYFTITSSGREQALNFIELVPVEKGCLPPVIDIEENGLSKEEFKKELSDFISLIEGTYRQKPILYVVYPLYNEYIKGEFVQYPIWIRDIVKPPRLSDNREWIFWQYCNRGRINGIQTYVDLNVFAGDVDMLKSLLSENSPVKGSASSFKEDNDFINFAVEGDNAEYAVRAVLNPALLERIGLKPVQVNGRQDVYNILGKYWDEKYIEKIWQSGSSMMPGEPFGFRGGARLRLADAEEIKVESRSENKVVITGKVLSPFNFYEIMILTLELTEDGWKIMTKGYRKP